MRAFTILFFTVSVAFSSEYYAKVNPYEIRDISSNVSGQVIFIDEDMIGRKLSSKEYLKIDSVLDNKELKYIDEKLKYLDKSLKISLKVLKNLKLSVQRKKDNYERVESLKIKSQIEKDKDFHDMVLSENTLFNTDKEIQNLKIQIADLKLREAQLLRNLHYKNLQAEGFVLYELLVKPGQVVNISTPLAKIADVSHAKLVIFLNESDLLDAKSKVVYLDEEKTSYKITRVSKIADSKNISKYMAQIIIDAPRVFSKLVKIDLKDE